MSQFVSNSAERRNSILRFTALFLLTVVLACFVFLRLFYVETEIPKEELQQFKDWLRCWKIWWIMAKACKLMSKRSRPIRSRPPSLNQ
ncbi:MAG: hypothetical protein IPL49_15305 [Saprospirales bacterium]|nr:hypothetical protein [Saprospirales bacterium]